LPHDCDGASLKAGKPCDDGIVFAKSTIAGERCELVKEMVHVVQEMRPARMSGHECFLPRRELGVGVADELVGTDLKAANLVFDVHRRIFFGELAKLDDLALELSNRTLKFEVGMHA